MKMKMKNESFFVYLGVILELGVLLLKYKKMKKNIKQSLAIYKDKRGNIEFWADIGKKTLWATQAQIAQVFEVERSVITKHIRNILKDKELSESQYVQILHILLKTVKHIKFNFIILILFLQSDTEQTQSKRFSSESGLRKF